MADWIGLVIYPILGAIFILCGFFFYLKFQTGANKESIDKLEAKLEMLESGVLARLSSIERSMARIEGRLSVDGAHGM